MWERFNIYYEENVLDKNDKLQVSKYQDRKKQFFEESYEIIEKFLREFDEEFLGLTQINDDFKKEWKK